MAERPCNPDLVRDSCAKWIKVTFLMYEACMSKAHMNDMYASASSMVCIILNVLIVGKNDFDLPAMAASIFVVINSVIKALQMQFRYSIVASQLHAAKGGLRTVCVKIDNTATLGKYSECTPSMLNSLRLEVLEAINAAPGFVNINPPQVQESRLHGVRNFMKRKEDTPVLKIGSGEVDGGAQNRGGSPLSVIPVSPGGRIDVEAPGMAQSFLPEAQHGMQPPNQIEEALQPLPQVIGEAVAAVDVGASLANQFAAALHQPLHPLPPPGISDHLDGRDAAALWAEAAAIVPGVASAMVEVQKTTLNGLCVTLESAVKLSGWYFQLNNTLSVLQSTIELVLNSLIMVASSLAAFGDFAGELATICAAVNAVLKGLEMKLQFEVRSADANVAFNKFKSLQERVRHAKLRIEAGGDLTAAEFDEIKDGFQSLVNVYAGWLPYADPK